MIETNIRILEPGPGLTMDVRFARVTASDDSPDLLWRACGALQGLGLAALPRPGTTELVVATDRAVPRFDRRGENWRYEVEDSGRGARLRYGSLADRGLLAKLAERVLLMQVERRTDLWRMNDSRSIWYEREPFVTKEGIAAYRRYEISGMAVGESGVGIAVNVRVAFFTTWTVADFFREDLPRPERERRKKRFDSLSARQHGQKGTLLYEGDGSYHTRCYFEEFRRGVTCASTGALRVLGQDYDSLLDYYRRRRPELEVGPDEPVAHVSFANIGRPQPVTANRLRLRVPNESLPSRLKQVDKIPPAERCSRVEGFWERLGEDPLGSGRSAGRANFWRPKNDKLLRIGPPDLLFGKDQRLSAPRGSGLKERQGHFRERERFLDRFGCFYVPPTVTRTVHVAVPQRVGEATGERLSDDLAARLSRWTRKQVKGELVLYEDTADAISSLRSEPRPGVVVFVMDDRFPETYYELAYELKGWRVKRIAGDTLVGMFSKLELAAYEQESRNGNAGVPRAWNSFVGKSALDVLQNMGCVPYVPADGLNYEAQLAIDVGHDRRYFSLSLLVCRSGSPRPLFRLETVAKRKSDPKRETINEVILHDEIVTLFVRLRDSGCVPVRSFLVLRDGRQSGREHNGIAAAKQSLMEKGLLENGGRVDVVDFHKGSAMRVRLWDRDHDGRVRHAFEGTAVLPDAETAILTNTGAATLNQGTARPVVLVANGNEVDMAAVVEDVHIATHLNWSSPDVAQWLPLSLKRTDEELKSRAAQEIRRIRTT
ncbi:MAG: hypothetical protein M3R38_23520 [Actinomycetota bacterium]|nr:hypothetical protein [Actinomycetota bacterium]MDP9478613.1 hypothetical protein [Actinomycetota bacterium]